MSSASTSRRPAPPRARHRKLTGALTRLRRADLTEACSAPPPTELLKAIEKFNAGEFFDQHETLELLWRGTPGEVRHLYEGILQVGVGMHHLLVNHNFHGAAVKLDHGIRLLAAFPQGCHGVDVTRLVDDARRARRHLLRLGPDGLDRFKQDRIPKVHLARVVG